MGGPPERFGWFTKGRGKMLISERASRAFWLVYFWGGPPERFGWFTKGQMKDVDFRVGFPSVWVGLILGGPPERFGLPPKGTGHMSVYRNTVSSRKEIEIIRAPYWFTCFL